MTRIPAFSRLHAPTLTILILAACLAGLPRAGQAQTAEQQAAIVTVIESQLNAFRRNDGPGAYGFAAPNIRTIFPTAEVFMDMVRGGYGFLIDPAAVEFLDVRAKGGDLYQAVRVIDRDGKRRIAIYQMERQEDGTWKIAAVYITEDPDAAV
ncbi:DUF4864 domain-containing protein [Hwanghaeella grinnelliae]|nr:DUF4864 domain-containing protein [Hwanghaeella grinnelliae]